MHYHSLSTMPTTKTLLFTILTLTTLLSPLHAFNITDILAAFPDYTLYNTILTSTKLSDEINTHNTVTCLVLTNNATSAFAANNPTSVLKNAFRLLTLLDYYDDDKLHNLPPSTTTTTLLQTTGVFPGNLGAVNVVTFNNSTVGFKSVKPDAKLESFYVKSVTNSPYTVSVLEVNKPVVFHGLLDPPADESNLTTVLENEGCKTFASMLVSSGVMETLQDMRNKGQKLTLMAPEDGAFAASGVPNVSGERMMELLKYHVLPEYYPKASLRANKGVIKTMASDNAGGFVISTVSSGDEVSVVTGVDTSRVAKMAVDNPPFCVLTIDTVLLPKELTVEAPTPAASPNAPMPSPAPVRVTPPPNSGEAPPVNVLLASPDDQPADGPQPSGNHAVASGSGVAVVVAFAFTFALMF